MNWHTHKQYIHVDHHRRHNVPGLGRRKAQSKRYKQRPPNDVPCVQIRHARTKRGWPPRTLTVPGGLHIRGVRSPPRVVNLSVCCSRLCAPDHSRAILIASPPRCFLCCLSDETCADYTDDCTDPNQGPALDDVFCDGACDELTCCVLGMSLPTSNTQTRAWMTGAKVLLRLRGHV